MAVTRPWSGIEIEVKMAQVIEDQDDAVAEMKRLGEKYAQARRDYEVKKAQTFLATKAASNTDKASEATATEAAADLRMAKDIAESNFVTQRAVVATLQSQADTLRSLARSSRDATDSPGFGS
jgi:hypothetical protein